MLLGGVVYGLTTVVSSMLAEENPMSASSVSVDWSSVPNVGTSSRVGGLMVSVPMSSRSANRLFHHPVVYSVPAPQGSVYSGSVSGYAAGGYPAAGSSSQGVYLTSSSSLQSYGGGAESGVYTSAAGHSAMSSASSSVSSYASGMASTGSMGVSTSQAFSPSYSFAAPSAASVYASADQTLSARKGARRGKNSVSIEDTYYQWLQSNQWDYASGSNTLTESQIRALWEALCAGNEDFALTYTYEEFYNWFLSKQSDETFKWKLPVGEGVPCLLLLCVGYVIVKYKQQKNQWI